ncbi:MAG: RHS repeat-associated core domain-containing protein, partial [Myxococcaceae bacterium]
MFVLLVASASLALERLAPARAAWPSSWSISSTDDSGTTAPLATIPCTQARSQPTDNSGSELGAYQYDGRQRLNCTYDRSGGLLDRAPGKAGFTGHRVESALELIYAEQRWQDPRTGTWLSRDDVGAASYLQSPNELNPWLYAAGNPIRYTDPDGRCLPGMGLA